MVKKLSFDVVVSICESKNILCLESEYKSLTHPMNFMCEKCEYIWTSKFAYVKAGKGCPKCNNQIKTKIDYQTILVMCRERNWSTLETEYINSLKSMKWKCNACEHQWSCRFPHARKQEVCRNCNDDSKVKKFNIENVKKIADKKGCILLEDYKRSDISTKWRCKECGYEWQTSFANINRKGREKVCPNCNGMPTYTIDMVKEIAKERDITCLEKRI